MDQSVPEGWRKDTETPHMDGDLRCKSLAPRMAGWQSPEVDDDKSPRCQIKCGGGGASVILCEDTYQDSPDGGLSE